MRIMAFDLSSRCIGCVSADIIDNKIINIHSAPIVPPQYTPKEFLKSKKKLICGNETIYTWARPGEIKITKAEKKKRDTQVRNEKDVFILGYISHELDELIVAVKPKTILVEKNEIFNGVLTSILLAKIMGVLHGIAGIYNIPIIEYRVNEVRKPYDVLKLVISFANQRDADELKQIPDIAKRAIRDMLEKKYSISFLSDDESDACLILDYHINHVLK